ncbi:MAG: flavin reductase family protein [Verrucomicrobiales bacterium]
MELDFTGPLADRAYPILASLICPRPIAWVTTLNPDGSVNVAPFSFFNLVGTEPPLLMFCPGDRDDGTPKDSARNARDRGEFVVNLVDPPLAEAMSRTSAALPPGESEALREDLTLLPSSTLATPRIAGAPASFECTVHSIQLIGQNRLILGLIQRTHVRDDLYNPESARIRTDLYHPVGRMASPNWYCHTGDQFELVRPA